MRDRNRTASGAGRLTAGAMLCLAACLASAAAAQAAEGPGRRPLCPQDAPEGVRLPARPGCDTVSGRQRGDGDGFRDLGNGVRLRVGGRASVDVHTGR